MMAAFFVFLQTSPEGAVLPFVFKLTDEATISRAREILADRSIAGRQVMGTISVSRATYNPNWSYHLKPDTISFFEKAVEVCDANPTLIEKRLDEVGGSFLPGFRWCPWNSHLTGEVTHLIDPKSEVWR